MFFWVCTDLFQYPASSHFMADSVLHHLPARIWCGADTFVRSARCSNSGRVWNFKISWLSSLLTNCLSCVAMDPTIRAVGALSLWSVEIVMQIRIYALFGRSKRIAIYNGVLFLASIAVFIWVMIFSAQHRRLTVSRIASKYRLPGCPAINGGIRWAVWVPGTLVFFGLTHFELTTVWPLATIFEFNLFCLALYKSISSVAAKLKIGDRPTLIKVLVQDNILYFLGYVELSMCVPEVSLTVAYFPE